MSTDTSGKVTAARLRRDAYLYIRQSTLYQVANNTESTARQYDLRGRAVALGWPADRIHVIDIDQGHSGASSADREGFQHLVAEVSLGRAGIILGLECSRLARNNADWHRLLQICAHNDTLILDEDGLYDPTSFNDRLVLGMKGQLSEAELHFLRARLRGGILAKARRGELRLQLPIGLAYDSRGETVLDPDGGVRRAISLLFGTFTATGSAFAVVKAFRQAQLTFPARHRGGPRAGELYFRTLTHDQVLKILHNPCYAGAYCYGRARHTTDLDGHHHTLIKPAEDWTVLLPDHHAGYITWPRYQANLQLLAANAAARGDNRTAGPAREGPALLQGLIICGRCGRRMTVRYHTRADSTIVPDYVCQNDGISNARPICQHLPGTVLDAAVAELLLATLSPLALEVALTVTDELAAQAGHADALRAAHVQRAQHAADQARRRYLAVDPGNRLVADALEADWNARLRELATAHDDYTTAKSATAVLDDQQRARIRALAADFPALWHDPATPMRERKRLIRLLITDVTLTRGDHAITAAVRLPEGQRPSRLALDDREGLRPPVQVAEPELAQVGDPQAEPGGHQDHRVVALAGGGLAVDHGQQPPDLLSGPQVRLGLAAQVPVRRQPSGQALRRQALVGQEAQEVRQGRPQARDGLAAQPALPQQETRHIPHAQGRQVTSPPRPGSPGTG